MQVKRKDINLIPQKILKERKSRAQTSLLFLIALFIVILYLSTLLFFYNQSLFMERKIIKLERDIAAFPDIQAHEEAHAYYTDFLEFINKVAIEIDKDDYDILNMLTGMEGRIPSAMTLNSISVSGNKVTMTGQAESDTVIADFIYEMKRLNLFDDIFVPSISDAGGVESAQKSFNVGMTLRKEGDKEQ